MNLRPKSIAAGRGDATDIQVGLRSRGTSALSWSSFSQGSVV